MLLYFLVAPPILMAAWKETGNWPRLYSPVMRIIESDYGGPLLWYFNEVWHAGIFLIGDGPGTPWHVLLLYTLAGCALCFTISFPIISKLRKRTSQFPEKLP